MAKRRWVLVLGLVIIPAPCVTVLWLAHERSVGERRRFEATFLGKTRQELDAMIGHPSYEYISKERWRKEFPRFRPSSEHDAAIGYWTTRRPPNENGAIRVIFSDEGITTDVAYSDFSGPLQQTRRWLGF